MVIGLTLIGLASATSLVGRPTPPETAGVAGWLPSDGSRARFAQPGNSDVLFSEWSRPEPLSLGLSDLIVLPFWKQDTALNWLDVPIVRLRTIAAGPDGQATGQSDLLWTLEADGARTAIDSAFPGEVSYFVPGRLDLPSGVRDGDTWSSRGTVHNWDDAAGAFLATPYRADFRAGAPSDPGQARRGCLEVAMTQQTGDRTADERRTWCPGEGIVGFTGTDQTWTLTMDGPPVQLGTSVAFDWNTADNLEFTRHAINRAPEPGSLSLFPVSPPGLLGGGAVLALQAQPELVGVNTEVDPLAVTWGARPGGTPTAAATMAGISLVATIERHVVAYNSQGRWLWEAPLSDLAVVPPVRFGDRAVLVTLDGAVTAFELTTGTQAWRTELGAEIRSLPVAAGDRLLVGNQAGALACLDTAGNQQWVIDAGVPRSLAVSAGPDPVVVFGENGSVVLRGYSLADGSQLWRNRLYQDARDLIALDSLVVVRDDDVTLGIDPASGESLWTWSGQRTLTGTGGGRRVLLMSETSLVLLDDQGRPVRQWPHDLGQVAATSRFLTTSGDTVLAYGPRSLEVGRLP
ncbi:MAG: PQQ-binding-like beta-propeller repeat protein [Propionicimonas sp.]|uniref:outer membrane protein assembly factor BamB family protein n=1 Tax=Propionicimonas sp. TaxID=1955623 RepID=UPI002B1F777D|nr:PQQ-binding-like beta-propeller repeat protein [Propionicimonas sp.]MEA4945883.1 PQQ-binding-like beta-propeller repeat protein [Propionicimonas sp.]